MNPNRIFIIPATLIFLTLFFCATSVLAQDLDLSQFYNSSEPHSSLSISSKNRLDSLYKDYLKEHKIIEDNGAYQDFIYDYNFFLEKLNKSGKVFSGDELTIYLNKMKDELLAGHPKKDFIKVYTTNFDQLNAFTNDFGNIYVNVATIAKIDSEMKLRVILAHEIAHVLMRHSFMMASLDNRFSKEKIEKISEISDFDKHQFSQQQELEADSIAYSLLNDLGYDIHGLDELFDNLNSSRNPVYSNQVGLDEICLAGSRNYSMYIDKIYSEVQDNTLFSDVKEDDSLSTHPSAEARKMLYLRIWETSQDSTLFLERAINDEYERYRLLAANVLARTLMTEHKYIESLYLVCQLRERDPNNAELDKLYLKLQVLITQSKYLFNESSIVNEYGSSCSDSCYLAFRRGILSIPALEMNIITITNIESRVGKSADPYIKRLLDFSYQFLYKYNPDVIANVQGELKLTGERILDVTQIKKPLLTSEQKKKYDELQEEGFIIVDTLVSSKTLIDQFVTDFDDYDEFKKSLNKYKVTRDLFEDMLTIDEFFVDFDPDESYEKFRKGRRNSAISIGDSAISAMVQSDTYVYTRSENGVEIDSKKTLQVEEMITELLQDEEYFSKDLTNLKGTNQQTSVRDNHIHYLLTNWIGECLNFEDLVYSVADEEISNYLTSSNTEYLIYNFNIINKSKSDSKYRCLYYNLYFDLKTMGVVYVSTIASSKKPKKKFLKHYFYQAHYGKS